MDFMHLFSLLFGVKVLRVSDALFVHHQEHYSTVAAATGVFHE